MGIYATKIVSYDNDLKKKKLVSWTVCIVNLKSCYTKNIKYLYLYYN